MITIDEVFQYSLCKLYNISFRFGPKTGHIDFITFLEERDWLKRNEVRQITEINLEKLYTYLAQENIITEDEKNYLLKL